MARKEIETLIVGGDDSNHAGTAKGEIIVATFSFLQEDSIVKSFPNTRNYPETLKWLDSTSRDYRYSLLTSEKYRHSDQNLVAIVPILIRGYMEENEIYAKCLKVFLDGRLQKGSRKIITDEFLGNFGIESIVVDNFIKKNTFAKNNFEKHPRCPAVVYHADALANHIYSTSLENSRLVYTD